MCVAGLLDADILIAQSQPDIDHRVVVEIGGAFDRGVNDRVTTYGWTLAAEATPIEGVLELESGFTSLGNGSQRRVAVDFLFKKPFRLSRRAEFMAGIGPEWSRLSGTVPHTTSVAAEGVLDFMFWPTTNVGWYAEPSYSFSRGGAGERSLGASAGVIIGFP